MVINPSRRFQVGFCATASDVVVPVCVRAGDRLGTREGRAGVGTSFLLGWYGSGGEWTDGQDGAPHRTATAAAPGPGPRVPPLKNEAPFCLYRRRAAVPQRHHRHALQFAWLIQQISQRA